MILHVHPFRAAMGLVSAILMAVLVYEISAAPQTYEIPQVKPKTLEPLIVEPVAFIPPPPEQFASISDRPLFTPSRTRAEVAIAEVDSTPPPNISLIGVILASRSRLAVVKTSGAPLAVSLNVGSDIGGWEVSEIGADRMLLRQGGVNHEVRINPPSSRNP